MDNAVVRSTMSGKRRQTRKLVLEFLERYKSGEDTKNLLEEIDFIDVPVDKDLLRTILTGVIGEISELDLLIKMFLKGWRLERLNRVDYNILLMASFELKFLAKEIPPKSVINEAIELAKEFGSTEKTPGFVNAILDKIWHYLSGGIQ